MDSTQRTLLQLPFEQLYTFTPFIPSVMLITLEGVLLSIACIQIIRFSYFPNIYLKKIIHVLIACQLIASILFELHLGKLFGVHFQPYVLFTIQESTFLFGAMAYFMVLLFWMDFNVKVRDARPGIKFLQTNAFALLIFGFSTLYIGCCIIVNFYFVATVHQGWKLSFKIIWWHLAFFCIITPAQLYYSNSIQASLDKFYLDYSQSFSKTKKILHAVNFCFILRLASICVFIVLYFTANQTEEEYLASWPSFICFYILDQLLPASIFMFLLRKSPKNNKSFEESKISYLHSSANSTSDFSGFTPGNGLN